MIFWSTEMHETVMPQGEAFYLFAGPVALALIILLISALPSRQPPREEPAPMPFRPEWLSRAPDDLGRMRPARASRRFLTLALLAEFSSECCSGIRKGVARIRQ
jgi:hypothetical protein